MFYEPGGLATRGDLLYVADTNNNAVRVVDLATSNTSTLVLKGIEQFTPPPETADYYGEIIEITGPVAVAPGPGFIELDIGLPAEHKVNEEAPSSGELSATGGVAVFGDGAAVSLTGATFPVTIPVEFAEGTGTITADLTVIYCHEDSESLCLIQQLRFVVEASPTSGAPTDTLSLAYTIELPDL